MDFWGKRLSYIGILVFISLLVIPVTALVPVWNTSVLEGVSDIAIADDGSRVIVGTEAGNARVYDKEGTLLWEVKVPGSLLVACQGNGSAFLLGSREDLYSNKGAARLYDGNGTPLFLFHSGWVNTAVLSNATGQALVANRMGNIYVLNRSGGEVAAFNDFPKDYAILSLSLSGDGKVFAYVLKERYPQVKYVTIASKSKKSFSRYSKNDIDKVGEDEPVSQVAISDDGAYIASAGGEGNHGVLCLYAKNGTRLWSEDSAAISGLGITANGSAVFTATTDGNITCYNSTGNITWTYPVGCGVRSASLSPEKGFLAAGTGRGGITLLNEGGQLLAVCGIDGFPSGEIGEVALSRSGNALAASVNKKEVHYFSISPDLACPAIELPPDAGIDGNRTGTGNATPASAQTGNATLTGAANQTGNATLNGTVSQSENTLTRAANQSGMNATLPGAADQGGTGNATITAAANQSRSVPGTGNETDSTSLSPFDQTPVTAQETDSQTAGTAAPRSPLAAIRSLFGELAGMIRRLF